MIEFMVSADEHLMRLDVFLSKADPQLIPSRSFAAKLILAEQVHVNGKVAKAALKLSTDDRVTVHIKAADQKENSLVAQDLPLDIVFEDEDILVINKQAGMVVHPGAGVQEGTLVNALLSYCPYTLPHLGDASRPGLVHRLDKYTSGLMVVAKTQVALVHLAKQFAAHTQERRYLALVWGNPGKGSIETWHGRDPKNRVKFAVQPHGVGKWARMLYHTKETFDPFFSLVECTLYTGRTHQIRVQLSHLGHGIVGDVLYTPWPRPKPEWAWLKKQNPRTLLHAAVLGFAHPRTGQWMRWELPVPDDFQKILELLRARYGAL